MQCPNCSEEIRETAKVCGHCGTRLVGPIAAAVPEPEPEPERLVGDVPDTPEERSDVPEAPSEIADSEALSDEDRAVPIDSAGISAASSAPKRGGSWQRLILVLVGVVVVAAATVLPRVLSGGDDDAQDSLPLPQSTVGLEMWFVDDDLGRSDEIPLRNCSGGSCSTNIFDVWVSGFVPGASVAFELVDPAGRLNFSSAYVADADGIVFFSVAWDEEDPPGVWTARATGQQTGDFAVGMLTATEN